MTGWESKGRCAANYLNSYLHIARLNAKELFIGEKIIFGKQTKRRLSLSRWNDCLSYNLKVHVGHGHMAGDWIGRNLHPGRWFQSKKPSNSLFFFILLGV